MHLVPAYVTLVRDPVEKFISHFRHRRVDTDRVKAEMAARERRKAGSGEREADQRWELV